MKKSTALCVLFLAASLELAYGQPLDRRQINQLQEQFTTCSVFYEVSGSCVGGSDSQLVIQMNQSADLMRQGAIMLGGQIGMTSDAMVSRYQMIMRRFRDDMQSDCVNISSILQRYAQACRRLSEVALQAR